MAGVGLAGCSTPQLEPLSMRAAISHAEPLRDFTLTGRLSARVGEQAISGQVRWERRADTDQLVFSGPMGGAVGELRRAGVRFIWIDAQGVETRFEYGAEALADRLGFRLPLDALPWWLAGVPTVDQLARLERDEAGRALRLVEGEWRVEYARHAWIGDRWLAQKLTLKRGDDMELRLVVDEWILP